MNARTQSAPAPAATPRRPGRPPLPDSDRTQSVTIRLRPATLGWIAAESLRLGLAPGIFLRHAIEALQAAQSSGTVSIRRTDRR